MATACAVATLNPRLRNPNFRPCRAAINAGLGLSAVVFILHGIILYGWSVQDRRMSLDWMMLMASFDLAGAAFYIARVTISTMYRYGTYNRQVSEKLHPKTFYLFPRQPPNSSLNGHLC